MREWGRWRENGWRTVCSLNSIFPVTVSWRQGKAEKKELCCYFYDSLDFKTISELHSWWHPVVCRMKLHWLIHSSIIEGFFFLFFWLCAQWGRTAREACPQDVAWLWRGVRCYDAWEGLLRGVRTRAMPVGLWYWQAPTPACTHTDSLGCLCGVVSCEPDTHI